MALGTKQVAVNEWLSALQASHGSPLASERARFARQADELFERVLRIQKLEARKK